MSDNQDAERTFPATPKRLEQARSEGQVARSRELATAAVVLTGALALWGNGPALVAHSRELVRSSLSFGRADAFDSDRMLAGLHLHATDTLVAFAPVGGLLLVAMIAAPMLVSGWLFSTKAFTPDFTRLSPARGLGNIFSGNSLVELAKSVIKVVLLGVIAAMSIAHSWHSIESLAALDPRAAAAALGDLAGTTFFALVGGLVAIALVDVPYQLWHYHDGLKMTREEVRQEQRESDGDPQLKAKIRAQQRASARRRMMAAVPTADVIVTNPTHYAVALEYKEGRMRAPRVVAKGTDLVAARIRALGAENNVPILEAPPLARALHRYAEVGAEVPQALYAVIAQVLAYVYQVRRQQAVGGPAPVAPTALDVPPGLDPLHADLAGGVRA
jgi:flagellar biosynthetic protein FlhB